MPFIRGIGMQDHLIFSDPGVGVHVDGIYLGRQIGQNWSLDIERVEILRGPQGTLFGKNATGGAVTVTTARPTPEFHGWAKVTTGRFDRADVETVINAPINERLLTRLAASSQNRARCSAA